MKIELNDYLKNPNNCPFCGADNIAVGDSDFGDINAWRNIKCLSCKKEWVEEFTITRLEVSE